METKDWFLVFGPLAGVIVGGGIASLAQWFIMTKQIKEQDRQRTRENLEELHLLVNEYASTCIGFTMKFLSFNEARPVNDAHAPIEQMMKMVNDPLPKIASMYRLNAPEFSEEWDTIASTAAYLVSSTTSVLAGQMSMTELNNITLDIQSKCRIFAERLEEKIGKI